MGGRAVAAAARLRVRPAEAQPPSRSLCPRIESNSSARWPGTVGTAQPPGRACPSPSSSEQLLPVMCRRHFPLSSLWPPVTRRSLPPQLCLSRRRHAAADLLVPGGESNRQPTVGDGGGAHHSPDARGPAGAWGTRLPAAAGPDSAAGRALMARGPLWLRLAEAAGPVLAGGAGQEAETMFCTLEPDWLSYYSTEADWAAGAAPRGELALGGAVVVPADGLPGAIVGRSSAAAGSTTDLSFLLITEVNGRRSAPPPCQHCGVPWLLCPPLNTGHDGRAVYELGSPIGPADRSVTAIESPPPCPTYALRRGAADNLRFCRAQAPLGAAVSRAHTVRPATTRPAHPTSLPDTGHHNHDGPSSRSGPGVYGCSSRGACACAGGGGTGSGSGSGPSRSSSGPRSCSCSCSGPGPGPGPGHAMEN